MVKNIAAVNIKPVGDRILIQFFEEKEQTRRGIIIPDSARERPQEAYVIALGSGKRGKDGEILPFEVKIGDKVLVSKYGTTEVTVDETKYCLAREEDILGVLP